MNDKTLVDVLEDNISDISGKSMFWGALVRKAIDKLNGQADTIEAQATRIEALEAALQGLQGNGKAAGTWLEAVEPLVSRFDIAAKFEADAVHNGTGAAAIAELMRQMAARLDMAVTVSSKALEADNARLVKANGLRMDELHKEREEAKLWFERAQEWKTRIEALEADLVEWKNQHENLLSVRQQDIAAMQAKIDTLEKELAFKNEAIRLTKGCPGKIVVRGGFYKIDCYKSKHSKQALESQP